MIVGARFKSFFRWQCFPRGVSVCARQFNNFIVNIRCYTSRCRVGPRVLFRIGTSAVALVRDCAVAARPIGPRVIFALVLVRDCGVAARPIGPRVFLRTRGRALALVRDCGVAALSGCQREAERLARLLIFTNAGLDPRVGRVGRAILRTRGFALLLVRYCGVTAPFKRACKRMKIATIAPLRWCAFHTFIDVFVELVVESFHCFFSR
jgi:hypothetical protein